MIRSVFIKTAAKHCKPHSLPEAGMEHIFVQ